MRNDLALVLIASPSPRAAGSQPSRLTVAGKTVTIGRSLFRLPFQRLFSLKFNDVTAKIVARFQQRRAG